MGKVRINSRNEKCSGCSLCVLSCSLARFGVFSTRQSSIKVDKNDRFQTFSISIDAECTGCGQCAKACAYGALEAIDANPAD